MNPPRWPRIRGFHATHLLTVDRRRRRIGPKITVLLAMALVLLLALLVGLVRGFP